MTMLIWMTLTNAHGSAELYLGAGLTISVRSERFKVALMLESEVREVVHRPPIRRTDIQGPDNGDGIPPVVDRRFVAPDIGAFLQVRMGGRSGVTMGALAGITRVHHKQAIPNTNHAAVYQISSEVGLSVGGPFTGMHLGGVVAARPVSDEKALLGVRGRTIWTPDAMASPDVDLLFRTNFRPSDCVICL
ncbi:MAG: hypothetical protein KTR31_22545 [Myxococcales bacterium]|nr:hypothetical protein [Myxococcales bacterium]